LNLVAVPAWRLSRTTGPSQCQDKLIQDVAAVDPNTIVALNTSLPVAMPWLDRVKAAPDVVAG